jgi:hypothetical protein
MVNRRGNSWKWALALTLMATVSQARVLAGQEIPDQLALEGKNLKLNGAAVQKKFIFQIYAVALYLENPTRNARQAIESDQVKRIHMKMLRNAKKEQVADALRSGVQSNTKDLNPLRERLDKLLAELPDVKAGDEIFITYVPGKGTELTSPQKKGLLIPGKDFADALLGIWLGQSNGIARIRRGLMGA